MFCSVKSIGCEQRQKLEFKKTELTDLIFENVHRIYARADSDPETIRISVDTKATANIGDYCRGDKSRGLKPVKAADPDTASK